MTVLLDDDLEFAEERPLKTKADVDTEIGLLPYERRLGMTARRAADVFSYAGMIATSSLLLELADAVDLPMSAAADFFESE